MKTISRLVLAFLFLVPFNAVSAEDASVAERAHALVQEFFFASDTPGLAVSVGLGNKIVWSEGFGHADVEQMVKVDPARTLFRIGSVIKPMTAHAAAQLVQAGKLGLEAPIQTYVSAFPKKSGPITTRQRLSHLSGIRQRGEGEFFSSESYETVTAGLVIFQDDPLEQAPGERFLYSSYGYNLVSAVLEGASGQGYLEYMAANVFRPLGMTKTVPDLLARIIPGRGRYYFRQGDDLLNTPEVDNSYKWASRGVLGTADDLVRFGLAQLEENPVTDIVHEVFWVKQVTNDGEETNFGLGWIFKTDETGT